jgi:uncharacterized membrane protein YjgN (DUF898 family)
MPLAPMLRDPDAGRSAPMSFTGTGDEYFRIWIVNLGLTVATLGVYSAWAKVRRLQYFYRHTRLAGAGFDYHGDPIAILKGRIVALVLFGLYSATGYVNMWTAGAIFVALALVLPWLLGSSFRFRLHNTSYRGLRFQFHGTVKQAYWIFLGLPLLAVASLLTLVPFWHHRLKRYQFTNAAYGRSRFSVKPPVGDFYSTYVLAAFMFFGLMILVFIAVAIMLAVFVGGTGTPPANLPAGAQLAFMVVLVGLYMLAVVGVQSLMMARIHNLVWNHARLEGHAFVSRVEASTLFGILLTNLLGTVATLGLFRPFAQVRLARYMAGAFTLVTPEGFEQFVFAAPDDVTAAGDEAAEWLDFDIAF